MAGVEGGNDFHRVCRSSEASLSDGDEPPPEIPEVGFAGKDRFRPRDSIQNPAVMNLVSHPAIYPAKMAGNGGGFLAGRAPRGTSHDTVSRAPERGIGDSCHSSCQNGRQLFRVSRHFGGISGLDRRIATGIAIWCRDCPGQSPIARIGSRTFCPAGWLRVCASRQKSRQTVGIAQARPPESGNPNSVTR